MTREHHHCSDPDRSRRRVLAGAAALAGVGLAGCLGDDEDELEPADPIDLGNGRQCAVCGMVIEDHHGPAGQVFYAGEDEPAAFDSVSELVVYHEERTARGETKRDAFVTDYSSVDYDLVERDGRTYVSSHVDGSDFVDATETFYVVGSEVQGAMGDDYVPFSDARDAEAFADEHGGDVREWTELSPGAAGG